MKYLLLAGLLVSCSGLPVQRSNNYTAIDRIEKCMLRLTEKNGVSPTEAERVCTNIFRRSFDTLGVRK